MAKKKEKHDIATHLRLLMDVGTFVSSFNEQIKKYGDTKEDTALKINFFVALADLGDFGKHPVTSHSLISQLGDANKYVRGFRLLEEDKLVCLEEKETVTVASNIGAELAMKTLELLHNSLAKLLDPTKNAKELELVEA